MFDFEYYAILSVHYVTYSHTFKLVVSLNLRYVRAAIGLLHNPSGVVSCVLPVSLPSISGV